MSINSNRPKVLFLHYHDAPYRNPVLDTIKRDERVGLFRVAVMFPKDRGHSYWGIDYSGNEDIALGNFDNKGGRKWHKAIRQVLNGNHYDCLVINGFYHYTSLYLLAVAFFRRIPAVFVSDNVIKGNEGLLTRVYEGLKIRCLSLICKAYWVPGKAAADYLCHYGRISRDQMFHGAYVMDMEQIQTAYQKALDCRETNRSKLGISKDERVFLMAANFLLNREHILLVEAFSRCMKKFPNMKLVLLGEGSELIRVQQFIKDHNLEQSVICAGGVGFDELADYYSLSDAYIHSGYEPYSTAVMYAAFVGMPLVLSRSVGATADILENGVTGFSFASGNLDALETAIASMAEMEQPDLDRMATLGASKSSFYTPKWGAEQLLNAIEEAIN